MRSLLSLSLAFGLMSVTASADDWKDVSSDAGGYKVKFPGDPMTQTQTIQSDAGPLTLTMQLYSDPKTQTFLGVVYNPIPADLAQQKTTKQTLDDARDGALKNIGGTLTSEKNITVNELPGREIVATAKGLTFRQRIILGKTKLFQQIVVAPPGANAEPLAKPFFESFSISKP